MAVCRMKSIDLTTDFMKILGTYFLYSQKTKGEVNLLRTIPDTQCMFRGCACNIFASLFCKFEGE